MTRFLLGSLALATALAAAGCRPATGPAASTTPATSNPAAAPEVAGHAEVGVYALALCPHAARTLSNLAAAAAALGPAVNVRVAFLGLLDEAGKPSERMGEAEIAAALTHICAQNLSTPDQWPAYLACAFADDKFRTGRTSAESCASTIGISADELSACLAQPDAMDELTSMYATSMALGIDQSPTMVVDKRVYLGETTAAAFSAYLCHNAGTPETRPAACAFVQPPSPVAATLLFDSRCTDPEMCDVEGEVEALHAMLPGLVLTRLDYVSEEGKHLFSLTRRANAQVSELPLVLFDETLAKAGVAADRLGPFLVDFGKGRLLPMGAGWNPEAEQCGNGVDDTGDGQIDCADVACQGTLACRAESSGQLELFIMSQCPYGAAVVAPVHRALSHFGKDRKKMNLRLEFVGDTRDGKLSSMHGQAELDEDLRMICAQALYPEKYLFMDYVSCRAKDFRSEDWKACLPKGMNAKKLEACATSDKGQSLLATSFALAEKLGVRGSPSWILNGKHSMEARTTSDVVEAFCERNELKECKKELAKEPDSTEAAPPPGSCR